MSKRFLILATPVGGEQASFLCRDFEELGKTLAAMRFGGPYSRSKVSAMDNRDGRPLSSEEIWTWTGQEDATEARKIDQYFLAYR